MNKMIILSQLSETIAALTGTTADDAEFFVRELSALIADCLETDGQVEVPGLGSFVVSDETVVYAPDRGLAEEINAPFAAFEAIELPDNEDDNADESGEQEEIAVAAEFEQEALADEEPAPAPEPVTASQPAPEPESEPQEASEHVKIPEYRPEKNSEPKPEPDSMPEEQKRSLIWPRWLIGCIVCFIAGYICGNSRTADDPVADPEPEVAETVEQPQPAASIDTITSPAPRPIVTDTIRPGYFLTSMARKHYGHLDFWPYIYEANASKLAHPDRLEAGTVVVIPPADSLNLDPQNAEQLEIARQKAGAIYSRFNSK